MVDTILLIDVPFEVQLDRASSAEMRILAENIQAIIDTQMDRQENAKKPIDF